MRKRFPLDLTLPSLCSWLCLLVLATSLPLRTAHAEEPRSTSNQATTENDSNTDAGIDLDRALLVEAESFHNLGGWSLDTQFIRNMGSPYLIAHGLGQAVADATTEIHLPAPGRYKVYVRTKDWVARWNAPGTPGRFQVLVDGKPLPNDVGTEGAEWHWQDAGSIDIEQTEVELRLKDLQGFNGRCDAIYFTLDATPPSNDNAVLPAWRKKMLGKPEQPEKKSGYDVVVVGGGYSGMGAAISAARMGCKVALIQDRRVLGGNGSSEVRVWAMGNIRRGKYPRIGEIVEEFSDKATKSPGTYEEFEDDKKEDIVEAEKNIDLFLGYHAYQAAMDGKQIRSVTAFNTRNWHEYEFEGKFFVDATGHGTLGALAGADSSMEEKGRMGMSNMWAWAEADAPKAFPPTPWALPLTMDDFPYPVDHHGQWFWESGFDKDPLGDAEGIRDWNLRAVFGAFNAMKNGDGAAEHRTAYLTWVAYIGGPRESRQLLGDVVLTQDDIVSKREFPDGCVPSTWSIDLHYPKKQYAEKFPDNPFISIAVHDQRVDRLYGYPIPYRCFYSRNIENLFMAGRCISVTHEALGTVRVMKTCGMMGEVVGKAVAVCLKHNCKPFEVYERHWNDMDDLLKLPGKAHRNKLTDEFTIPENSLPLASALGPMTGLVPSELDGIIIDNKAATLEGKWTAGDGLKGYVAYDYIYASPDSDASARFEWRATFTGQAEIKVAYQSHENRGTKVPVNVAVGSEVQSFTLNMKAKPPAEGFHSLGYFDIKEGEVVAVTVLTTGAGGIVHADAVQVIPQTTP